MHNQRKMIIGKDINQAQALLAHFVDMPLFEGADLALAVHQTTHFDVEGVSVHVQDTFKAPHAYRPTPPRKHHPRTYLKKKLFKGHRP